jgi:type I site-specific restriction endonuclease
VSFLGWAPRSEYDVEDKIKSVLERFVGQKFNGVTITRVQPEYEVEGRRADIAVLKDDGNPLLIIETKKKKERGGSWSVERRFIPTSEDVVGQAASYAALLKRTGVYVPFIATANDRQLALFKVPENIESLVNWNAISKRDYGRVIKDFYKFKKENLILHKPHGPFSEEFFKELLDAITGIYVAKYRVEEKKQEQAAPGRPLRPASRSQVPWPVASPWPTAGRLGPLSVRSRGAYEARRAFPRRVV